MRKVLIIVLTMLLVLSLLTACGNNKQKELDALKTDIETLTNEWLEFGTSIGERTADVTTMEDLNKVYTELAGEAGEFADKFGDLGDELDAIKDGISDTDYKVYKAQIDALKDGIEGMKEQMENAIVTE